MGKQFEKSTLKFWKTILLGGKGIDEIDFHKNIKLMIEQLEKLYFQEKKMQM